MKEIVFEIKKLSEQVQMLNNTVTELKEIFQASATSTEMNKLQMLLNTPIKATPFSTRTYNALFYRGEIHTIGELILWSKRDLMRLRNFGQKSLQEVEEFLNDKGLVIKD